jgi:hypothetical protein
LTKVAYIFQLTPPKAGIIPLLVVYVPGTADQLDTSIFEGCLFFIIIRSTENFDVLTKVAHLIESTETEPNIDAFEMLLHLFETIRCREAAWNFLLGSEE